MIESLSPNLGVKTFFDLTWWDKIHRMTSTQLCDLHIHTCYSDGRASPAEVIEQAATLGLASIAITDHDNTRGSRAAQPLAKQKGIELIPGIEFTTRWEGCPTLLEEADVDVLGYFMNLEQPDFRTVEDAALDDLHQRTGECCLRLTQAGTAVTLADVFVENPNYAGILQLIHTLMHKGYHATQDEAYRNVLTFWRTIRPGQLKIDTAIEAIHRAGGIAVLAHPTLVATHHGWLGKDEIVHLVEMGLDGLEIYHYRLDREARVHFLQLANKFKLGISGGSDEHGWPGGFPYLGTQPVNTAMVTALRDRSAHRGRL